MKKIFLFLLLIALQFSLKAQRIAPAPAQDSTIMIVGTVHVGNGQVIQNGAVVFDKGKITYAGDASGAPAKGARTKVITATGKQIYPGIIDPNSTVGLVEIDAARATVDFGETGIYNPGVRSLIAYNTDSKIIPTLRSNGILLVQSVPQGGTITGASSVMQLDAWNWQDAAYRIDDGIHLNWPSFFNFTKDPDGGYLTTDPDYEKDVNDVRSYFSQAKAYNEAASHEDRNINFEAMKGLFDGSKKLYIHCDYVKEIMNAVNFGKDYNLKIVIVGGRDSYMCTDLLKNNNVEVMLGNIHSVPSGEDEDVNMPYSTAAALQKAGILYCLSFGGSWNGRNLPFTAGTTVAFGVSKEDALKSITSNTARILGIDDMTGTLETGKDANIIVSAGDIMDMKTNNVQYAFIQGRQINLDNFQKQLYHTYMNKYGLK